MIDSTKDCGCAAQESGVIRMEIAGCDDHVNSLRCIQCFVEAARIAQPRYIRAKLTIAQLRSAVVSTPSASIVRHIWRKPGVPVRDLGLAEVRGNLVAELGTRDRADRAGIGQVPGGLVRS